MPRHYCDAAGRIASLNTPHHASRGRGVSEHAVQAGGNDQRHDQNILAPIAQTLFLAVCFTIASGFPKARAGLFERCAAHAV
jgi:hypothetical protein